VEAQSFMDSLAAAVKGIVTAPNQGTISISKAEEPIVKDALIKALNESNITLDEYAKDLK